MSCRDLEFDEEMRIALDKRKEIEELLEKFGDLYCDYAEGISKKGVFENFREEMINKYMNGVEITNEPTKTNILDLLDERERLTIDLVISQIRNDKKQLESISQKLRQNRDEIVGMVEKNK